MALKGQSIWEYAFVLGLVALAFIGMNMYFKRGLQGRLKDLADSQISKEQYVSTGTKSVTDTSMHSQTNTKVVGNITTTTTEEETSRQSTEYNVSEDWKDLIP
ncbi:MAG: hypothetical protein ISS44_01910 [Candidatus Omnitrophica bacterium]|nr:hypothetical protein [Candidatus Omnitrophota bacterium]